MLQRWKIILTNWMNCYFSKSSDEQNLNIESLVTIISHLRENLNLDESKSAILEANTVEEFLCEKYPDFKFEDGTVEASNEEEVCLSASLLLFFVCVNSKNFDIKNAMCSKLSSEDQETILKFSKSLMDCPVITVGEVQAAITEACGQDIAAMELPQPSTVAETPPALRSMHSNTRRLQAALEAERFDRNYLQEELSRVNNKMERLLKEKEKHKFEILNLKAKISLCCGDEAGTKNAEAAADVSAKLTRQLQQLEARLEETQTQLDDVVYERDSYKAKMDELKNDRDKWLALSQQENARVSQLTEELEMERRHSQSLKDLVVELRQHNRLNGLDCSVECDDPDSSMHSLQHNSSICSEVCVNVVEVQLGEERAKTAALQQQIQTLQIQISELNQIREADKSTLKNVLAQRENDICNLKHRINEEIEEKNNLTAYFDNEKIKLNNEINELEQRLKENYEYLNAVIEKKMEEIQTLQEEKLSLIQSLNNKTTKLENIIKDLQSQVESEKQSRRRMKEGYENHLMELNVKVLNRNNELVELQNSVFEKGEQIEKLQVELKNEKVAYSKLITQYEILDSNINAIQNEMEKEKEAFKELMSQHQILNVEKSALQIVVEEGKKAHEELLIKYQKLEEEKGTVENRLAKEQEALKDLINNYQDIHEKNNAAQTDLKKVKEAGKKLQNKFQTLQDHHKDLKVELAKEKEMFHELNSKYEELIKENKTIQIELVQNKKAFEDINHKYKDAITQKNTIESELDKTKEMVSEFGNKCLQLEKENNTIQTGLQKVNIAFDKLTNEYKNIVEQNKTTQIELKKNKEAFIELSDKYQTLKEDNNKVQSELLKDKEAFVVLTDKYLDSVNQSMTMEKEFKTQKVIYEELLHEYRNLDEHKKIIENDLKLKCDEEQNLKEELENKVHSLKEKLTESENLAEKLKQSYECQIENLNIMVTQLTNYMREKTVELDTLKKDKETLLQDKQTLSQLTENNCKVIKQLEEELKTEKQNIEKLISDFESERQVLKNMVTVTESVMEDIKISLSNEIAQHLEKEDALELEKNNLQTVLNGLELKYQDLDIANASLLSLLRLGKKGKEDVEKESELIRDCLDQVIRCACEDKKANTAVIKTLESQNQILTEHNEKLKTDLNELEETMDALKNEFKSREEESERLLREKAELEETLKETANNFTAVKLEVKELEDKIVAIIDENNNLKMKDCENLTKIYELQVSMRILETELATRKDKLSVVLENNTQAESELQNLTEKLKAALEQKSVLENHLEDEVQHFNAAQQKITELNSKIIELTNENNNMKLEEDKKVAKIRELDDSLKAFEESLKNKLEMTSQEKLQLNSEITTLTEQLKTALSEKAQAETAIQEHTQKLTAVQLENKELENRIAALFDVNNNLKMDNSDAATKLEECRVKEIEFEKNLELAQCLINNLKVAMNAVEKELKTQNDELLNLTDENNNLKQEKQEILTQLEEFKVTVEDLKVVQNNNEELKAAMNNLETDIQAKGDMLNTLLEEKAQVENNLETHVAQLAEITEKKSELEETLRETTHTLAVVQNDITELKNEITKLLNEKSNLETEKNQCLATIEDLQSRIKDLELAQCLVDNMKVAMNAVETELKTQNDELLNLTDENNNLKQEKQEILTKLEEFKTTVEDLKVVRSNNEELKAAMNSLETDIQAKGDMLKTVLEEKSQVENNLETHVAQLAEITEKKSELEETLRETTQTLAVVQKDITELKNEVTKLLNEKKNLETEKKECSATIEELQSRIKDLELAQCLVDNMKVAMNAVEKELKTQNDELLNLTDKNNNLKQEKQEILTKLEEFKSTVEDLKVVRSNNEELKAAMNGLETDIQAKGDMLKTVLEEKSLLENNLETHVAQLAEITEKKSELEVTLRETTQTLAVVQNGITELKNEVAKLLNEKNNLETEKKECAAIIEELQSRIKDLEAVENINQELKANMNVLQSELQTQTDKLQKLAQEKSMIENELLTQKDQLTKISDEKSQIEKALEEKTEEEKSHSAMITKLTNYVKEKTVELETLRKDKDMLQQTVGDSCKVIKTLEDNLNAEKLNLDKLTSDFESERQMLKNMVSATESIMEDTKLGFNNQISQHIIAKDCMEVEKKDLQNVLKELGMKHKALEMMNTSLYSLLKLERKGKQEVERESEAVREFLDELIGYLNKERNANMSVISALEFQEKALVGDYEKMKNDFEAIQTTNHELKVSMKALETELQTREAELQNVLEEKSKVEIELKMHADQLAKVLEAKSEIETVLNEKMQNLVVVQLEIKELKNKMADLFNEKNNLELEKRESCTQMEELKAIIDSNELKEKEELSKLKSENQQLLATIEENRTVIANLEQLIKHELEENHKLRDVNEQEKLVMGNKMSLLQDYQNKAEKVLEDNQKETVMLQKEIRTLQSKVQLSEQDSKAKDGLISKMSKEKDAVISTISKELVEEKALREKLEKELQQQKSIASELRNNIEIRALKKENEQLIRAIGQQETFTALCQEKATEKYTGHQDLREPHQVDSSSSDNTHSSVESLKTITDLEKIIHDKNRTITTLQTDITFLKSLMAESETKLLDVSKELEISKDNVQQLSNQLKKIVNQKNEEIVDLKKQVTKMSATENRATQIIKVSAKYQAMILKRVAEIKSNTVLKELTNFGNCENDVRRSLAGSITMEDLENFLETTDRHLKRCSEKQIALQKERDRLTEVNRIQESEIINLKKFLTELSVSFQTFSSVKDLYGHKLSRVISIQRTVRREILNLDGRIADGTMCKLERGYGAVMQDLAECTMNLERWVARCISRTVSVEKIKQAFTSDTERSSLASPSFQNTGLEVQLEELEKSFHKLLEEILRASKSEGATETQASTVMEVRAEYEDKLNRMKAKMKELFNEQMALLKNKQREDVEVLERELQKTRSRMEDSKRAYESHIKTLTKELWTVGEKFLVKNDEAEWLRRNQRSGSLMSLQHVHSSGLFPAQEPAARPSDAHSLRSLPTADNQPKGKRDGRGLHMSDEEGEVFDNRCLKELAATPRRDHGQRLSELKWRNSLCPPHLKSSYPAETQFAATLDEDDLKAGASAGARPPRKEVGITAYKKPGPPTPSKQAGRLSATDSELRESLRVEAEPLAERRTSTPARFRAFLRLNKHDSNDGTPRTRRLSNIFRKK